MIKIKFQYSPYNIEFAQPFNTARGNYNSRKGFIIVLTDSKGRKSFGEAAPLPEFGSETYEEAEKILGSLNFNIKLNKRESL